MRLKRRLVVAAAGFLVVAWVASLALGQNGPQGRGGYGRGRGGGGFRGRGPDAQFAKDWEVFHFLLDHHDKIQRTVTNREDGVVTLTESADAKIAEKIREHVAGMKRRVEEGRPIRRRDPLFDELFRHAHKITMRVERTEQGARVTETSEDPFVARLIQEHAKVVSSFAKGGYTEAHKNHPVPPRGTSTLNEG